ncbi:MAG TPA: bacillithiol biosynthesis BshC [Thermoanaerobaculia bacterium]|nr:bacillithiol biosynthesis BshC [Thermoanaerobaculia bacterium]
MTTMPASPLIEAPSLPLEHYPSISRFALDLVTGRGSAARWLERTPPDSWKPPAAPRRMNELAGALAASNAGWGNDVEAELDRWNRGETVTLVAGQQVGFGGGPLYTLAKIASLLALRDKLAARGVASTIFFWMATEDSDFDEVATISLQTRGNDGLQTLRPLEHSGSPRRIVGDLAIPESLRRSFLEATQFAESGWLSPSLTFGESFARLLAEALSGRGVVLVDSLLPQLRRQGAPLFRTLAERIDEAESLIAERSRALTRDGYQPQVERSPDGHYALLFAINEESEREPLRRDENGWMSGDRRLDERDVIGMIDESPERISTAALARPLLQDFVFGPSVFVGGPAEVSYYAQLGPLHRMLRVEQPHVALRGHALVAPARFIRAVDKYGIDPAELAMTPEEVIARHDAEPVERMQRMVGSAASRMEEDLAAVRAAALAADAGLERSIEKTMRKIRYHFEKLSQRSVLAVTRADAERYRAVQRACATLFPAGQPQDRVAAWVTWWHDYGTQLVDRLVSDIEPDQPIVKIIPL